MHPIIQRDLMQARVADLRREAERVRLAKEAGLGMPHATRAPLAFRAQPPRHHARTPFARGAGCRQPAAT